MKPALFSLPAQGKLSVAAIVTALLFVGPSALPVRAQGFQGVEPGQSFDIDLKAGGIQDPLPFDVHFYFTDKVDDPVASVEVRGLGFKTAQDCDQALADPQGCSNPAVVDCHPPRKASAKGEPGKRTVELLMTPLQPNRYYCFGFEVRSNITDPAEKSRVASAVAAAVVAVMNQNKWLTPAAIQSTAAVDELRTSLLAEAQASVGPGEVVQAEPGSFFDTSVPVRQFDATVGAQVSRFLTSQLNVPGARTTLQQVATGASGALTRLSKSPLWQIAATALAANAGEPRVAQLLAGRQDALQLLGLPASEIVARSEGHSGTLDQIWDPSQIDMAAVRGQLRDLQNVAAGLRTDEDLRNAAGLGETALAAQIAQACGSSLAATDPLCSARPVTPPFFSQLQSLADDAAAACNDDLEAAAGNLKDTLTARLANLSSLAGYLNTLVLELLNLRASTVADYQTRATWYVGADLGAALAWDLEEAFTYAGANIYFRPVNKKAHLSWSDWKPGQRSTELRKRFSVMIGLPQNQLQVDNLEPLVQGRPLLVGAGLRLSDFLRFTFAGALVFKEKDPNPLVDDQRLAWSPFIGLSIDWNIAGTFRTMFQSVFPGGNTQQQEGQQGGQ